MKRIWPVRTDNTFALALGDVDGDGDLDLVLGNEFSQNRLYLNEGGGGYRDATKARMPVDSDSTYGLAVGDIDADGDLDILMGNSLRNRLYVNDGSGSFTDVSATQLPEDRDNTRAVALGDVDGDGDLDAILGNASNRNALYLNDGTGTFSAAPPLPGSSGRTHALALGDVDGDGDTDVVVGNRGFVRNWLYLNDGTGAFTIAPTARMPVYNENTMGVGLADLDGDGDLDIVLGNDDQQQNRLFLNNGAGTFIDATSTRLPPGSLDLTRGVVLGDVDGDGDPDIMLGNIGQTVLYLNDGTGTYTNATAAQMPVTQSALAIAQGDIDGDGDLDIVLAHYLRRNSLLRNNGSGTFRPANLVGRLPVGTTFARRLATGDVDGDGDLDIVLGNENGRQNRLYLNDGTGVFTNATEARMPRDSDDTRVAALGDVDGDGDLDILCGNDSQQNRLYLNDGTGRFTDVTKARMPADTNRTQALALGDVDRDGDVDLVVGNGITGAGQLNRLYLNDGTGTFSDATGAHMPLFREATLALALGDVDADGDLDLVVGNSLLQNKLYLNDGSGKFTYFSGRFGLGQDDTRAVTLGDVDGDGDLDLLFGNNTSLPLSSGQNRLYLNNGLGGFTDVTRTRLPVEGSSSTTALVLGDVDVDGDLDIVVDEVARQARLYLNDGTGAFTDASAARLPTGWAFGLVLADVDGDQDLDILLDGAGQMKVFTNLHRQLSTPLFPTYGQNFGIEFHAEPGYATSSHVGFVALGWALSPVPLPIPGLGTFFLAPNMLAELPPVTIPQATGTATRYLYVPPGPPVGLAFYLQGLILDTTTGTAHFTGYTADQLR